MSRAPAPSADRIPSSRVRWATLNDITPNRPTPAISAAKVANAALHAMPESEATSTACAPVNGLARRSSTASVTSA